MVVLPQVAEHVRDVPRVSAVSVKASHPLVLSGNGSNVQFTVTLLTYHPFAPSVPRITGVIEGPLAVAPEGTSRLTATAASAVRRLTEGVRVANALRKRLAPPTAAP